MIIQRKNFSIKHTPGSNGKEPKSKTELKPPILNKKKALSQGKILVKDAIADITLQQVLTRPKEFDVIATMNLNGDYLSDALAAQVGGIGIAPGGNVNYETGHAILKLHTEPLQNMLTLIKSILALYYYPAK